MNFIYKIIQKQNEPIPTFFVNPCRVFKAFLYLRPLSVRQNKNSGLNQG